MARIPLCASTWCPDVKIMSASNWDGIHELKKLAVSVSIRLPFVKDHVSDNTQKVHPRIPEPRKRRLRSAEVNPETGDTYPVSLRSQIGDGAPNFQIIKNVLCCKNNLWCVSNLSTNTKRSFNDTVSCSDRLVKVPENMMFHMVTQYLVCTFDILGLTFCVKWFCTNRLAIVCYQGHHGGQLGRGAHHQLHGGHLDPGREKTRCDWISKCLMNIDWNYTISRVSLNIHYKRNVFDTKYGFFFGIGSS